MIFSSIDTITLIGTAAAIQKMISKYELKEVSELSQVYKSYYEKSFQQWNKNSFNDKHFYFKMYKIAAGKTIDNYMIVRSTYGSIDKAITGNRNRNYKLEIAFIGLSQPQQEQSNDKSILKAFIKRFKVYSIDIAFDGLNKFTPTVQGIKQVLGKTINEHSSCIKFGNSVYINNPTQPNNNKFHLDRFCIYDKYNKKGKQPKGFNENWKRFEVRFTKIDEKLNNPFIDSVLDTVAKPVQRYFQEEINNHNLNEQLDLMLQI